MLRRLWGKSPFYVCKNKCARGANDYPGAGLAFQSLNDIMQLKCLKQQSFKINFYVLSVLNTSR